MRQPRVPARLNWCKGRGGGLQVDKVAQDWLVDPPPGGCIWGHTATGGKPLIRAWLADRGIVRPATAWAATAQPPLDAQPLRLLRTHLIYNLRIVSAQVVELTLHALPTIQLVASHLRR